MQQLQVNLTVSVPEHLVLVERVEYESLKESSLQGIYWTMQDLENRIGKKQVWIKENILYQPKFKKQLDVLQGGFVYYPKAKGEKWSFHGTKMANFLEDNFYKIFNP